MVYETFCKNLFEKTTKAICSGLKESIGIIKFKIGDLEMASSKDYLQFVLEQLSEFFINTVHKLICKGRGYCVEE